MGAEVSRSDRACSYHCALPLWLPFILLYVVLRSWQLTSFGLWADEVFSVRAARLPWRELFGSIAADAVHPPLFYVLLKMWMAVGGSTVLWLKLLPLVVAVAALLPCWLLCRDLNLSLREATLAFWLMAVNGYLIHYSQELRMYSLLFCLSLWSLWLFLRLLDAAHASARVVVALFVVNVLLVHTHYFGWLLVGTEWLCVLAWRPRRLGWFSVSVTALALVAAPWAYAVASASTKANALPGGLQWITRPGWADLLWYLATLNGLVPLRHTTPLGILLFGGPIALALFRDLQGQRPSRRRVELLCVFAFVPVVAAFAASRLLSQSVWGERHLIIVALPYLVAVAASVSGIRRASWRMTLIVLIVTWSGVAAAVGLVRGDGRVPWKSLVQHVLEQEGTPERKVTIYAFEGWTAAPLEFLLSERGNQQFSVVVTEPGLMKGEHFWVAFRDPSLWVRDDPRAVLEHRGCRLDAERSAHDGGQRVVLLRASC